MADIAGLARAAYSAINRSDLEGFLALVDPAVEFKSLIAEAEGQSFRGHDGVREWWQRVAKSLGGLRWEPEEIFGFDDRVYVKLVVTANVSGVDVPQTMWQAARVREQKFVWWAVFRTEAEAREALGLGN